MLPFKQIIIPLIIGFILDLILGDPRWLPHPIRLFGFLINYGEKLLYPGKRKKLNGAFLVIILTSLTWISLRLLMDLVSHTPVLFYITAGILVHFGIANRNLLEESWKVIRVLKREGLEAGRQQLSTIVGRDTSDLTENQIRIAVLETLAENLSDGVVAPLFYYAIGGVPLLFCYKMINTLDSMIAYKNDHYRQFGFFAARVDDVANYLPARITAFLMALVALSWRGLKYIFKYGHQHASPNAGYPEAALAGILNCRFGGTNSYHGIQVQKPLIGKKDRSISDRDIKKNLGINLMVSILVVLGISSVYIYLK